MLDKKKNTPGSILSYVHEQIQALNTSKIFAGIMIITLNIVSKFVNIKLSKTMESYLRYTFSKYILVFTIAWMGTRDIYIALFIMFCFIIISDFLLDEESWFCVLPEEFKDHHLTILEENENMENVTDEQLTNAKKIIEKAKEQKKENAEFESYKI
jgi:ABC-type multidrug transport system fused ATPase/permease subunit